MSIFPRFMEKHERILFVVIMAAAAFIRLYNTPCWILANVDEVSALNQVSIPFLSGAFSSTNYLYPTVLYKILGSIIPFPFIRWINALINLAALYATYAAVKKVTNSTVALLSLLFLTLSWNVVYYSRIFESGSFTPSAACFFLCCMVMYISEPKRTGFLYLAGFLLGVHLNTHTLPVVYTVCLFYLYLISRALNGRLSWKTFPPISGVMLLGALPYLYSLVRFSDVGGDMARIYGTIAQPPSLQVAVNFRHPLFYLKTAAEYLTFHPLGSAGSWVYILAVLSLLVPLYAFFRAKRSDLLSYLCLMTYGSLVVTGLSPMPIYNEGHLHFFFPHFVLLCALLIYTVRSQAVRAALVILYIGLVSVNGAWLPIIFQNQVSAVSHVIGSSLHPGEPVYVSDGALLKLENMPGGSGLEGYPCQKFFCQGPEAFKPFANFTVEKEVMIIATSDCPWPPPGIEKNLNWKLLLFGEQLFESHSTHGLSIYKVWPQ